MKEAVQAYIGSLNWGYRVQLRSRSVTYINSYGELLDPHTVKVRTPCVRTLCWEYCFFFRFIEFFPFFSKFVCSEYAIAVPCARKTRISHELVEAQQEARGKKNGRSLDLTRSRQRHAYITGDQQTRQGTGVDGKIHHYRHGQPAQISGRSRR